MAVLRKQLQVKQLGPSDNDICDCLLETTADLSSDGLSDVAPGSMAYCLSDKKVYAKKADGTWAVAVSS